MLSRKPIETLLPAIALLFCLAACAQQAATHTFHDRADHVSFDYPANWTFAEQDHEISTFHLDARTAPRNDRVHAVVAMPENPYPASTFSGAYVYFSVTPHSSAGACARQATPPRLSKGEAEHRAAEAAGLHPDANPNPDSDPKGPAGKASAITLAAKPDKIQLAGIGFTHGRDEQREVCLTQHDDVYTTYRSGACLRFDLAINNFCSAGSGARDITPHQLDEVRSRLLVIVSTVRFDPK